MTRLVSALLDPPSLTAERFASIERDVARVLGTERDVVVLQAEAILALEAAARGLGVAGATCLNVITGPYGAHFGEWLAAGGAEVIDLEIPLERAVTADEIAEVLRARPEITVLSFVHAEVSTGTANPLAEIAAVARAHDVLTVVDSVAAIGGHPLPIDELGLDVVMVGPQKALGGPAGVSALTVSPRAWEALAAAPAPWRGSILSLLDWKERWIDAGRTMIPGTPSPLEMYGLEAACARLLEEGMDAVVARHERFSRACRAGVAGLGAPLWVAEDAQASRLTTAVRLPDGVDRAALVDRAREAYGVTLTPGGGALRDVVVRIDHMGPAAVPATVLAGVAALGGALRDLGADVDPGAGTAAALAALAG